MTNPHQIRDGTSRTTVLDTAKKTTQPCVDGATPYTIHGMMTKCNSQQILQFFNPTVVTEVAEETILITVTNVTILNTVKNISIPGTSLSGSTWVLPETTLERPLTLSWRIHSAVPQLILVS